MPMSMCMYSTMVILAQGLVSCGAKRLKHQDYTHQYTDYGNGRGTLQRQGAGCMPAWTRLNKAVRDYMELKAELPAPAVWPVCMRMCTHPRSISGKP
jgi:hypothetical protein